MKCHIRCKFLFRLVFLFVALPLLIYASNSFADDDRSNDDPQSKDTSEDRESAKIHFEAAKRLYKNEKYSEALDLFMKAYSRFPRPEILYNIGKCYDKLGDYASAIKFYEQYVLLNPQAEDREEVKELITNLKEAIKSPEKQGGLLQEMKGQANYNRVIGYSLSAAGVVFVALGPVFYLKSDSIYEDVKKHNYDDATSRRKIDDINFYDNLSIASYIVGGVLIGTSAYFLFKGDDGKSTASIIPISGGYLISFQGGFE